MTATPMTIQEIKLVSFIEQYWHLNSSFPDDVEIIKQRIVDDFDSIHDHLFNDTFRNALLNRGISLPVDPNKPHASHGLTEEQTACVLHLLNFRDPRSKNVKLKELGISHTKFSGWMKDPKFRAYFEKLSSANFQDSLNTAQEALVRSMEHGNVRAIEYYMELTGRHSQQNQTIQDIKYLLSRIIEAINYHITDPEKVRAISNDFNLILEGKEIVRPIQIESKI